MTQANFSTDKDVTCRMAYATCRMTYGVLIKIGHTTRFQLLNTAF